LDGISDGKEGGQKMKNAGREEGILGETYWLQIEKQRTRRPV